MSDQDTFEQLNDAKSSRAERRARVARRRADRHDGGFGWMAGLLLIAIGVLFMLYQYGILTDWTNWWALFILLPGLGVFSAAVGAYRRNGGQWTGEVIGLLFASLFFLGMTIAFFFDFSVTWIWPLFLIGAGLLLLAGSFFRGKTQ
jgi:hypothetical protein